jgi:hypothetical protein
VAATTGVGEASFHPTLDQVIFALKANLGLENAQIACMGLIKVSLLLYYKRIFVLRVYQMITNVLIVVVVAFEFTIIMVSERLVFITLSYLAYIPDSFVYCLRVLLYPLNGTLLSQSNSVYRLF